MNRYFSQLNYSLGDEDSRLELAVMSADTTHAVSIAGSGGRVLPLLARQPRQLTCIDMSVAQLAMTSLRLACLDRFDRDTFLRFMGYRPMSPPERESLFYDISLAEVERRLLKRVLARDGFGPVIYTGRFERALRRLSAMNRVLVGACARAIFDQPTLAAQRVFYREHFPRRRFELVTRLLGNASVLNALLYRGAFPARNIEGSAARFYDRLFYRLLHDLPVRESFFLQLLFLGDIVHEEGMPAECDADVYQAAKAGLRNARVELVRGDLVRSLRGLRRVDFVSASDVPSFMPDLAAQAFLQSIRPTLSDGATVVTRGHLRVIAPRLDGFRDTTAEHVESIASERTQLWHVHVYRHQPVRIFSRSSA